MVKIPSKFMPMMVFSSTDECYDWVSSEEGETSETGRSAELAFVQRDWS